MGGDLEQSLGRFFCSLPRLFLHSRATSRLSGLLWSYATFLASLDAMGDTTRITRIEGYFTKMSWEVTYNDYLTVTSLTYKFHCSQKLQQCLFNFMPFPTPISLKIKSEKLDLLLIKFQTASAQFSYNTRLVILQMSSLRKWFHTRAWVMTGFLYRSSQKVSRIIMMIGWWEVSEGKSLNIVVLVSLQAALWEISHCESWFNCSPDTFRRSKVGQLVDSKLWITIVPTLLDLQLKAKSHKLNIFKRLPDNFHTWLAQAIHTTQTLARHRPLLQTQRHLYIEPLSECRHSNDFMSAAFIWTSYWREVIYYSVLNS